MGRSRLFVAAIVLLGMAVGTHGVVAAIGDPQPGAAAQASGPQVERLTPVASEVTVAPGSDLLFEVAVTGTADDHPDVTWYVDGERRWSEYPAVSPRPHLTLHDVDSGTHMVTGIVRGESGELGTVAWVVHVEDGANEPPALERVTPATEQVEVVDGEPLELTLRASDAEGDLHRVLWFAGMCDDPLGGTAVEGAEDEATLTYEPGECGLVGAWAVDERGAIDSAGLDGLTSWGVETTEGSEGSVEAAETSGTDDASATDAERTGTDDASADDTETAGDDDGSADDTETTEVTDAGTEEWHTLTVDGQSSFSRTDYSFTASGSVEAESGIGWGDTIDGSSASGFVRGGADVYRFSGDLERLDVSGGDGVVSVDGEPVSG